MSPFGQSSMPVRSDTGCLSPGSVGELSGIRARPCVPSSVHRKRCAIGKGSQKPAPLECRLCGSPSAIPAHPGHRFVLPAKPGSKRRVDVAARQPGTRRMAMRHQHLFTQLASVAAAKPVRSSSASSGLVCNSKRVRPRQHGTQEAILPMTPPTDWRRRRPEYCRA